MLDTIQIKAHHTDHNYNVLEYVIQSAITEYEVSKLISHITTATKGHAETIILFDCRKASLNLNELGKARLLKCISLLFHNPMQCLFLFEDLQQAKEQNFLFVELNKKANLSCFYTDDTHIARQWMYYSLHRERKAQ